MLIRDRQLESVGTIARPKLRGSPASGANIVLYRFRVTLNCSLPPMEAISVFLRVGLVARKRSFWFTVDVAVRGPMKRRRSNSQLPCLAYECPIAPIDAETL